MKGKRKRQNKYDENILILQDIIRGKKKQEQKEELESKEYNLNYAEYLFVILEMKIPFQEIQYYLIKCLGSNGYQRDYHEFLKPTILSHISQLMNKQVQQYWRYQSSHKAKQKSKQQLYSKYELHGQTKESIKNRIRVLQERLIECQASINSSRKQKQENQYQNEYNEVFKQLSYWKNKRRVKNEMKKLQEIKQIKKEPKLQRLKELVQELKEVKTEKNKKLSDQPNYEPLLSKEEQLKRIKFIFKTYSRKGSQNLKFFSDFQGMEDRLNLQPFLKFIKDFSLQRILKIDQITKIFKAFSKGKTYIEQVQFYEVISQIHRQQCIEEDRNFSNVSLGQYVQQQIIAKNKIKKLVSNKGKDNKYTFKALGHSGKSHYDVQEELKEKKRSLQYLAGPKNKLKFSKDKKSTIDIRNQTISTPNNRTLTNTSKQSTYIGKFKALRKRFTTQPNSQQVTGRDYKTIELNKRQNTLQQEKELLEENEESNDIVQELRDLIQIREEDEYLSKHLLPPIRQKRALKRIHF